MRYHLEQCVNDPQVWKIIQISKDNAKTIGGLLCVYVEDFLLTAKEGAMQDEGAKELGGTWKMSTYVTLTPEHPITFSGHGSRDGIQDRRSLGASTNVCETNANRTWN